MASGFSDFPEVLGHVAPGSTAYVAGNDAFTAAAVDSGTKTVNISVTIDTATTCILRLGTTNITLNGGGNLGINQGFTFAYQVSAGDGAVTIRFGNNCNIVHLLVTTSGS